MTADSSEQVTWMKKIQAEFKRLFGTRDDFLSLASHELKTPLTPIQLQTQMVKHDVAKGVAAAFSPARMERLIDLTERQVSRLTRLVDEHPPDSSAKRAGERDGHTPSLRLECRLVA